MLNVGGAYFCIKLVRYIFLGWLPFYLTEVLKYGAADAVLLASIFDVAGAVGSIACGFISDKIFGGRSIVVLIPMCFFTAYFATIYPHAASYGRYYNMAIMAGVGLCSRARFGTWRSRVCGGMRSSKETRCRNKCNGYSQWNGLCRCHRQRYAADPHQRAVWLGHALLLLRGLSLTGMLCICPMALHAFEEWRISDKKEK